MELLRYVAEPRSFFTRREAIEFGHTDAQLTSGVRRGELVRIRHGYYASADRWAPLQATQRHLLLARAVLHSLGPGVALSHVSAALAHGMVVWGVDLDSIHVTRLDGVAGRQEAGVVHHVGRVSEDDVVEVDGMLVVRPDRAAMETAILASSEGALVVFDSFLHRRLGDHDDLLRRFSRMARWPATQHLHIPVRMADGGADGPGESRGRWLFRCAHLPAPIVQFPVYGPGGELLGTCDWGWPEYRLLGEFDGRFKYGRLLQPGQDVGEVVFGEKQREDALREVTDFRMVRLIWVDLDRPSVTASRVRAKMSFAA